MFLDTNQQNRITGVLSFVLAIVLRWYGWSCYAQAAARHAETTSPTHAARRPLSPPCSANSAASCRKPSRLGAVVLFLDDVHWADHSHGRSAGQPRPHVPRPPRPDRRHLSPHRNAASAAPLLGRQARTAVARRLHGALRLGFLAPQTGPLPRARIPRPQFPADFAELIHARTEGSPLFMADVLRYLRQRGVIARPTTGGAGRRAARPLARTPRIRPQHDPAEARAAGRGRSPAALRGRRRRAEFDSAVVAAASASRRPRSKSVSTVLQGIHALVRLVHKHELPDGTSRMRYAFVHILYQQALYQRLLPTRRAALSLALARAMERTMARATRPSPPSWPASTKRRGGKSSGTASRRWPRNSASCSPIARPSHWRSGHRLLEASRLARAHPAGAQPANHARPATAGDRGLRRPAGAHGPRRARRAVPPADRAAPSSPCCGACGCSTRSARS